MIVLPAAQPALLGGSLGTTLAAVLPPAHAVCVAHSPSLGSSPSPAPGRASGPARGLTVGVAASAYCPPRGASRTASGSATRFAPALSKRRTARRGGSGGGGSGSGSSDGDAWAGDFDELFGPGAWDGLDASGGSGSFGGGRRHGGGGGGGGWHGDHSNSEYGPWAALAGAAWLWQCACAASLAHSLLFVLWPQRAAARSVPSPGPLGAAPASVGLC